MTPHQGAAVALLSAGLILGTSFAAGAAAPASTQSHVCPLSSARSARVCSPVRLVVEAASAHR